MGLSVTEGKRIFKFDDRQLADPDPGMTADAVLNFYSAQFPELTTSTVSGPKMEDGHAVYKFKTTVGTKG